MRKRNSIYVGIAFCFFAAVALAAEAKALKPVLKATLDKPILTIGEKFRYKISVEADKNTQIELPDVGQFSKDFAVKDFGSTVKKGRKRQIVEGWYVLDTYNTGKIPLKGVKVKYRRKGNDIWEEAEVEEKEIEVKSLLAGEKGVLKLKEDAKPVNLPSKKKPFLLALLLAVIAGTIGLFFYQRKKIVELAKLIPAHEIAFKRLAELKVKDFPGKGQWEKFYVELSDIVRRYIEARFAVHAPQMSSEEFLIFARERDELNRSQKELLREFLLSCDLVKFARYAPVMQEADNAYLAAENFIKETHATYAVENSTA